METTVITEEILLTNAPVSLTELGELQLAIVGGGIGETVL